MCTEQCRMTVYLVLDTVFGLTYKVISYTEISDLEMYRLGVILHLCKIG